MEKRIKYFVLLGPFYLITLSFLYTFAFWKNFEFNIYQFIGVNNVITYSINNIVLLLVASTALLATPYLIRFFGKQILSFSKIDKDNLEDLDEEEGEYIFKKDAKYSSEYSTYLELG